MRLTATEVRALPPLAWCLTMRQDRGEAHVLHGSGVHAGGDGFTEGAWAGPFSLEGFQAARYVAGSGGVVGREVRLRCSTHTLERLFAIQVGDRLFASNSLPFVLAASESEFDPGYAHYEADFLSFLRGPRGMRRMVPLAHGRRLQQYCWHELLVSSSLRIRRVPLPVPAVFPDFASYRAHLVRMSGELIHNATAPGRGTPYRPLALVSRGYDSPACAVIARECGTGHALTFATARPGFDTADDDGTVIAQLLGMDVRAVDRQAYRHGDGQAEAQFLASGGGGEDVVLASATDSLRHAVVFTGFLGDTLWGLQGIPALTEAGRITYPGGGSIGEYRLHTDFVHVPLPMLDLRSHASVLHISQSPEMQPWRVGGEYDRPIPRRIAEEAGIPRDAFGQSKRAVTEPSYYDERPIDDFLGPAAAESFRCFVADQGGAFRHGVNGLVARSARVTQAVRQRISWRASAIGYQVLARLAEPTLDERWRRMGPGLMLLPWGVARTADEYRTVLSGVDPAVPAARS